MHQESTICDRIKRTVKQALPKIEDNGQNCKTSGRSQKTGQSQYFMTDCKKFGTRENQDKWKARSTVVPVITFCS